MRILGTIAVLALGVGTAQADNVFSAPAYAGPGQTVVVCYYSVLGGEAVTFTRSVIYREPGVEVPEVSETCNGSIAGRCRTVAENVSQNSHWCEATVNNKNKIRGRAEYRNSAGTVLTSEEVR